MACSTLTNEEVKSGAKRAKELILEHGWVQGHFGSKLGGFCATGALREAFREQFPEGERCPVCGQEACEAALKRATGTDERLIWRNDRDGQTKEGVLSLFDTIIAELG